MAEFDKKFFYTLRFFLLGTIQEKSTALLESTLFCERMTKEDSFDANLFRLLLGEDKL